AKNNVCDQACNYYACDYDGGDCSAGTKPFEKCESPSYCAHVFRDGKCDPAKNNVCDQACNYYACDYDGGDCSAGTKPFEKCESPSYCAHVFRDGKCDPYPNYNYLKVFSFYTFYDVFFLALLMGRFIQICNNQECLFDGFDCDSAQEQCQKSDYCTGHYGNENCDPECNVIGCGWDGGDCDSADTHSSLAGNIIVILLISPEEFVRNAQTFLFTLSQKLRGSVRIRTMNGKPMIYSWSSEKGVG
ncbi:unnamed protein product, partial [Gongylonema pulchrum]|uniref:LNR domain-containing protein n=1 Tax=Gongylonema pulchrum TaxID=637853 RepID=A0A183ENH6_9BILA